MSRGLVLLHGFTGGPESWEAVVGAMKSFPPILAPTLLGHGKDEAHASNFHAEVDRLADAVRRWGEPLPHLVGYSLGARLGLSLLARHRDLFGSATLIGVNPGLSSEDERAARREADGELAMSLRSGSLSSFVARWERLPLFASQRALPSALQEAQRALRLSQDAEGLALSLDRLGLGVMPPLWEPARRISAEVELLVGAEDAKFRALGSRLLSCLSRGRLDVVAGAGHNLPLERPDEVAAAVDRALGKREMR